LVSQLPHLLSITITLAARTAAIQKIERILQCNFVDSSLLFLLVSKTEALAIEFD